MPTSSPGSPSRALLRLQLRMLLRSDVDLDRFCIDYFPDIYYRFTVGMEREQKLNLLLVHAEPDKLLCLLSRELSHCTPSVSNGEISHSISASVLKSSHWSPSWASHYRYLWLMLLILIISLVSIVWRHVRSPLHAWIGEPSGNQLSGLSSATQPAVQSAVAPRNSKQSQGPFLRSQPLAAHVYDLRTGVFLGNTPLLIPKNLRNAVDVCIRHAGYYDVRCSLDSHDRSNAGDIYVVMNSLTIARSVDSSVFGEWCRSIDIPCQIPSELGSSPNRVGSGQDWVEVEAAEVE